MNYYFGFGSNMSLKQMEERCPDSKLVGRAFLKDYKIDFTAFSTVRNCGCADIIKSEGSEVWGLLFEISDHDKERLDTYEGHPTFYTRCEVRVVDDSGKEYLADAYEVAHKSKETLKPSAHYLGLMQTAAEKFEFPEYYRDLLSGVPTVD